jgi:hypothetical protein
MYRWKEEKPDESFSNSILFLLRDDKLRRLVMEQRLNKLMPLFLQKYRHIYFDSLIHIINAYKQFEMNRQDILQDNIAKFYFWLRDVFLPFLKRAHQNVSLDIYTAKLNSFFQLRGAPTLEDLLKNLRAHFSGEIMCSLHSIFLGKLRRNLNFRFFMKPQSPTAPLITGFLLAKLQRKFMLHVPKEMSMLYSKLDHVVSIEGKLLRRRLLVLSVAQNLIKRLSDSHRDMFFLLMRVLSARSFA